MLGICTLPSKVPAEALFAAMPVLPKAICKKNWQKLGEVLLKKLCL
jgi:hypothetical protein